MALVASSETLAAVFFAASAIQLGIALLVLFTHPRRVENQLAAAILALSGGSSVGRAFIALDASGPYQYIPFKLEWGISFLVLALALYYPHRLVRSRAGRAAILASGAAVLAMWALAILAPQSLGYHLGATASDLRYAWATVVHDDARYWITTVAALAIFASSALRRDGSRAADYAFIAFAFGPVAAIASHFNGLADLATAGVAFEPLDVARRLVSGLGALAVIAVAVRFLVGLRGTGNRLRTLALWLALALAIEIPNRLLHNLDLAVTLNFGDVGYILVRPLVLGYALLRHQVFDVDVRAKRSFAGTILVVAVAALFLPAVEVIRRYSGLPGDMALVAGMAVGIGIVLALYQRVQSFAHGASDRVFRGVHEDDSRYLGEKKREVYRASIARALDARLSITPSAERELAEMRKRFDIPEAEHEALVAEAREAAARTPRRDEAHEHAAAEPGALLLARYRVAQLIGEGGSAWTYRCHDTRLGREVAVKEVRVDERRMGLREARLLASVHHPRVVTLHEVHESGSRAFLVMELMRGSLADLLAREGRLPPARAARIVAEVLDGLEALHAAGLVHRDLKPSNVLLDAQGRAKVADLGIARVESAGTTRSGLARAGTPAYMAPEQVLGTGVDARTDVYAAAALLYEALAGESYVRAATREGRLVEEAIVSLPPPLPLAGCPAPLDAWMTRAFAKEPSARFASAREARAALAEASAALTPDP